MKNLLFFFLLIASTASAQIVEPSTCKYKYVKITCQQGEELLILSLHIDKDARTYRYNALAYTLEIGEFKQAKPRPSAVYLHFAEYPAKAMLYGESYPLYTFKDIVGVSWRIGGGKVASDIISKSNAEFIAKAIECALD